MPAADILQCTDMTVLERQRARVKWQQEHFQVVQPPQQQESFFTELNGVFSVPSQVSFEGGLLGGGDSVLGPIKPDTALENGRPQLGKDMVRGYGFGPCGPAFYSSYAISRTTTSCPPAVAAEAKVKESSVLNDNISAAVGRESFKKRKADKVQNAKVCVLSNEILC